jgi:hypothetical protein
LVEECNRLDKESPVAEEGAPSSYMLERVGNSEARRNNHYLSSSCVHEEELVEEVHDLTPEEAIRSLLRVIYRGILL